MTLATILLDQVLGIFTDRSQILEIEGVVDLFTDEIHSVRIQKTSQPIETGSSITDNSIVAPQRLRMAGFVSNLVPALFVSLPVSERGKEAWVQLEELAKKREPVTIQTTLKLYENFLIVGLDARSDEQTGTALDFTVDFEEILFADSQFTTLPADILAAPADNKSGTVEGGIKQSIEETPERSASLLSKILGDE